jgi:hypothetical protein
VLALFAAPGLFLITYRVSTQDGTPPSLVSGGLAIVPGIVTPSAPGPARAPAPCTANSLMASSVEVSSTNGVLSGNIYITGRRAMPACTLQGIPAVEILDANGNLLPVTQVSAPMQTEMAEPVFLGSPDRPYPAVVSIVWSSFCQAPTPPGPYSLRITLPDGDSPPLTPPLITADTQGYPAQITSLPRCDASTAPSTLMVGPFRAFAPAVPHDIATRWMNETRPTNAPTIVPTLVPLPVMTATPRQPSSIGQIVFASQRDGNLEIYLLFDIPRACFQPDCHFRIRVDADHQINESNKNFR